MSKFLILTGDPRLVSKLMELKEKIVKEFPKYLISAEEHAEGCSKKLKYIHDCPKRNRNGITKDFIESLSEMEKMIAVTVVSPKTAFLMKLDEMALAIICISSGKSFSKETAVPYMEKWVSGMQAFKQSFEHNIKFSKDLEDDVMDIVRKLTKKQ